MVPISYYCEIHDSVSLETIKIFEWQFQKCINFIADSQLSQDDTDGKSNLKILNKNSKS